MIEILFGQSEAGAMKYARQKGIIGDRHEDKAEKSKEVVCLGFMLDIGNIKESIDSGYRKNLIYSMYAQQCKKDWNMDDDLKKVGNFYVDEWNRMIDFLNRGEEIRIWYSDIPYSLCGFANLCCMMEGYMNKFYTVKLPKYKKHNDTITKYQGWDEISTKEFSRFQGNSQLLTEVERRMYADLWEGLIYDNSPLRTVINGELIGVREDFYDFLIYKQLTGPMKEVQLISSILAFYPIGVSYLWYAYRINKLIIEGKIKKIDDSENNNDRIICRV